MSKHSEENEVFVEFFEKIIQKHKNKELTLEEKLKILNFCVEFNAISKINSNGLNNLSSRVETKDMLEYIILGWYVKNLIST